MKTFSEWAAGIGVDVEAISDADRERMRLAFDCLAEPVPTPLNTKPAVDLIATYVEELQAGFVSQMEETRRQHATQLRRKAGVFTLE